MEQDDYSVGYGRPPKASRFKKGESGNPNGRPKTPKGPDSHLIAELSKKITVNEHGQRKRISKHEALMTRLVNEAISGKLQAAGIVCRRLDRIQIKHDAVTAAEAPKERAHDNPEMLSDEQLLAIIARGFPDVHSEEVSKDGLPAFSSVERASPSEAAEDRREDGPL